MTQDNIGSDDTIQEFIVYKQFKTLQKSSDRLHCCTKTVR